jgi:hypothetical protein
VEKLLLPTCRNDVPRLREDSRVNLTILPHLPWAGTKGLDLATNLIRTSGRWTRLDLVNDAGFSFCDSCKQDEATRVTNKHSRLLSTEAVTMVSIRLQILGGCLILKY